MNMEKALIIDQVEKSFHTGSGKEKLQVLDKVSLSVEKGEIIALLGPSGCGKSTLLNIAAGFEKPDQGLALFLGDPIRSPSPDRGVVFQSSVLMPWLTVKENIAFGLKLKKLERNSIDVKCENIIQLVGLNGFEHYYPHRLSGGMQQRVALARALVLEPRMLLLDEPFAALDAQTRMAMQELLLAIVKKLNPTVLFVTHDVEEALLLSDRVFIMSKLPGRIMREIAVPFERLSPVAANNNPEFLKLKSDIVGLLLSNS